MPYKAIFPRARRDAYLDTAAEGLPLPDCAKALAAYFNDKSEGTPGRRALHLEETAAYRAVARLLGAAASDVALVSSTSEALNTLANSIDWRPGDEVVTSELEFPSGVLAWLRLRTRGVRLRVVPSREGALSLEDFAEHIGRATRVVCVSHVSYKTGARTPFVSELARMAHGAGALLVLDATQSLGRLPVPLTGVDFLVASSYKWLLGVHGLGVVYLAPAARERLEPGSIGWYSVQQIFTPDRFERYEAKAGAGWLTAGMPIFPSIYALRRSVEFLAGIGVDRIDDGLQDTVRALRDGLCNLGLDVLTPAGEACASGIVSFAHAECERIGAALEERGVIVWAGDGRVRASVHLYNDRGDVDRLLEELRRCSRSSTRSDSESTD